MTVQELVSKLQLLISQDETIRDAEVRMASEHLEGEPWGRYIKGIDTEWVETLEFDETHRLEGTGKKMRILFFTSGRNA